MPTSDLPAFFARIAALRAEFFIYDDGFRGWTFRYEDIGRLAGSCIARLRAEGIHSGDKVLVWSESRPGWIIALWACLSEGVVVVPLEPQSSLDLFRRIEQKVRPRLVLLGDRIPAAPPSVELPFWRISELERDSGLAAPAPASVPAEAIAEIVFTSGTTAEPKGVLITHANLAAQIRPVEGQFAPYRKYVHWFAPIRILNLLPMSHLFGQTMATFIPPLIPGSVVFISSTSPAEIVRQIRSRRIAVLVAVPKVLEILRDYILHRFPELSGVSDSRPWPSRWWRYRAIHRLFGWKFCCFVSGGAPLAPDIEQFWSNLAFVIVQGYGLTETAPIISFTHPFHPRRGTTGKPVPGVDIKIADDGEVLVRGANVTPGYFEAPEQTSGAFTEGWLRTGDFGEWDAQGNLVIRGRKKDMIVTPEGLKVFPEDVEAVLNRIPGVRESAVIGKDRVHAVLVLDESAAGRADDIVRQANATLEEHQKIRSVSLWTGTELPRTKTTLKLRRGEIATAIDQGLRPAPSPPETSDLASLLAKYAPGRTIRPDTTLSELGLSSLDRVGLMMDIEAKVGANIDESAFTSASRIADLAKPLPPREEFHFPVWNRSSTARLLRGAVLETLALPLTCLFAWRKVSGLENLDDLKGPVIFAANHQSQLDTPVIFASLPFRWRRRIAPAMWKEYFDAHFHPERHSLRERLTDSLLYGLAALFFNGFPLPQTETSVRESIRYTGELVEEGWSILIFPEGARSDTDDVLTFFPGTAMIASHLRLPVVPVRIRGVNRVLPRAAKWPSPGTVEVAFGKPLRLEGPAYAELTRQIEAAVRNL